LDSGTDLPSFQPTAADILTVTGSDLFIYVGGESDKWVDDIFNTTESGAVRLNMMETLGENVVEEETVEGMEAEEEHEEEEERWYGKYQVFKKGCDEKIVRIGEQQA
jgi:zinc transport system substrate-binding protein